MAHHRKQRRDDRCKREARTHERTARARAQRDKAALILKRVGRWLLFPPPPVAITATVGGGALLAWALQGAARKDSAAAYASYVLTTWALVFWCARLMRANPLSAVATAAQRNPLSRRLFSDGRLRLGVSTAASFGIDVIYTASNAISAHARGSLWFGTLAAYYAALAVMRLPLSLSILRPANEAERRREHTLAFICGVLLVLCTPVFAGFVVLALHRQSAISYPPTLIYGVALYAFYSFIGGVVKLVRARTDPHPAVRGANALYLVVAAVSMLSLEVAMIDQLNEQRDERFRTTMIAATGAAVCAFALSMGLWMALSSARHLCRKRQP